jgi:hypothetical protein
MSDQPKFRRGDLVEYEGQECRVVKRRRVTPLAAFATAEWELLLEAVGRLGWPGWVGDNEVTKAGDGAGEQA